jgi:hypothetical protein
MADAAEKLDLVTLEGHASAATMTQPASRQRVGDDAARDLHARGQTFEGRDKGRSVRLPRGQPAQHDVILPRRPDVRAGRPESGQPA